MSENMLRDSRTHFDANALTPRQKKMAQFLKSTKEQRSWQAPAYFLFACLGKLIFGFGASQVTKGLTTDDSNTTILGGVLTGGGFICIVLAALGFGAGLAQCNRKWGLILKATSIFAGTLIAGGYALNQYFVSTHGSLLSIRLSFFPLFVGGSLLTVTLPNFTAYTELVRGRCPKINPPSRPFAAMCFLAPGIGTVFAGWITGEKGEWPVAFNAAVLTVAMAMLYFGASLFWSNHVRREAEWASQCMIIESYMHAGESNVLDKFGGKEV